MALVFAGSSPVRHTVVYPCIMSGRFWKWMHFVGIFMMLALWAIATLTGLVKSVTFVSHVSMLALVLAEFSAWQSSRTEQKQDKDIDELEDET